MEIGERNIHSEDELDQIGKGEGSVGDSNCHYVPGLPVECPMTHTTHALQSLDVGLLSPLKQAWARAVASEEYDGRKVMKANFLEIYRNVHLKSFTSANILSSFHKTGIWPLDPTIITTDMMAMSTTESVDIEAISPIVIPSPVKQGAQYFQNEHERQKAAQLSVETPYTPTCLSQTPMCLSQSMFHTPSHFPGHLPGFQSIHSSTKIYLLFIIAVSNLHQL